MTHRATDYLPLAIRAAVNSLPLVSGDRPPPVISSRSNFGLATYVALSDAGLQPSVVPGSRAAKGPHVVWRVSGFRRVDTIDIDVLNLSGNVVAEIDCVAVKYQDTSGSGNPDDLGPIAQNMAERILEQFQRDGALVEVVAQFDDLVDAPRSVIDAPDFVIHTIVVSIQGSGLPDPREV